MAKRFLTFIYYLIADFLLIDASYFIDFIKVSVNFFYENASCAITLNSIYCNISTFYLEYMTCFSIQCLHQIYSNPMKALYGETRLIVRLITLLNLIWFFVFNLNVFFFFQIISLPGFLLLSIGDLSCAILTIPWSDIL